MCGKEKVDTNVLKRLRVLAGIAGMRGHQSIGLAVNADKSAAEKKSKYWRQRLHGWYEICGVFLHANAAITENLCFMYLRSFHGTKPSHAVFPAVRSGQGDKNIQIPNALLEGIKAII